MSVAGGRYPNIRGASFIRPYPGNVGTVVGTTRLSLRRTWGNTHIATGAAIGNFRLANNAGDPLSRVNFSSGGPNMVGSTNRNKVHLSSSRDGGQSGRPHPIPASTTNGKYVYDSSNFIRFKRDQAVNRGYAGLGTSNGDYSAGGANNGSQVAFRRARIH